MRIVMYDARVLMTSYIAINCTCHRQFKRDVMAKGPKRYNDVPLPVNRYTGDPYIGKYIFRWAFLAYHQWRTETFWRSRTKIT